MTGMRNIVAEIEGLEDGIYLIEPDKIANYSERWDYGFLVPIRAMQVGDLKNYTLFMVTNGEFGPLLEIAKHVDTRADAIKLANDFDEDMIYSLADKEMVLA